MSFGFLDSWNRVVHFLEKTCGRRAARQRKDGKLPISSAKLASVAMAAAGFIFDSGSLEKP